MRSHRYWLIAILVPFVAFAFYFYPRFLPDFLRYWNIAVLEDCTMNPASTPSGAGGAVSDWLQSQINILYGCSTDESSNFDTTFSDAFDSKAKIVQNHETVSLESFKDLLQQTLFAVQRVDIEWRNISEENGKGNTVSPL